MKQLRIPLFALSVSQTWRPVFTWAVAWLFFLQLFTSFVATNYAFGLLNNRLPPEALSASFLLTPFALMLPLGRPGAVIPVLFVILVGARLAFPLTDEPYAVLLITGTGVGSALLLLPLLLGVLGERAAPLAAGLALAVGASIALRALGSGLDLSTSGAGQLLAWPLAAAAVCLRPRPGESAQRTAEPARTGEAVVLGVGVAAALALVYVALMAPNVVARWTGAGYLWASGLTLGGMVGWCLLLHASPVRSWLTPWGLRAATLVFGALLLVVLLAHQVGFPADAAAYPLKEAEAPGWAAPALALMLLLAPVVFVSVFAAARRLQEMRPTASQLGLSFGIGAVLLGAMTVSQILTTTYDYVPVIGPLFRDRFWAVTVAPAVLLVVALFALPPRRAPVPQPGISLTACLAALAVVALGGAVFVQADAGPVPEDQTLTVVTFNVHQGYGEENRRDIQGQLDLLRSLDADIIGLQESDTNRVANGNDDLVRYLANELDLYSYHGPRTVTGSFGIALLSRFPIEDARAYYLYSEGEQTAAILATVTVAGRSFDVLVTHLGNGGPQVQLEQVLELTTPLDDVVLMGDFNFRTREPQYGIATERLVDAWALRWPEGTDGDGLARTDRIDYVFLSPGTGVRDADYVDNTASDHPALVVTIAW